MSVCCGAVTVTPRSLHGGGRAPSPPQRRWPAPQSPEDAIQGMVRPLATGVASVFMTAVGAAPPHGASIPEPVRIGTTRAAARQRERAFRHPLHRCSPPQSLRRSSPHILHPPPPPPGWWGGTSAPARAAGRLQGAACIAVAATRRGVCDFSPFPPRPHATAAVSWGGDGARSAPPPPTTSTTPAGEFGGKGRERREGAREERICREGGPPTTPAQH